MRSRTTFHSWKIAIVAALPLIFSSQTSAQQVQFTKISAQTSSRTADVSTRESVRIERFLSHVFPTRIMKHYSHNWERPFVRRVTYAVTTQRGKRFVIAGFTSMWHEAVDVLGIYRLEKEGPNQVWRSGPWRSDFYGWRFTDIDLGTKSLLLFQEGAEENTFGLASVISYQNFPKGLLIRDLTPVLPDLRATTNFPFRPLYGQNINLRLGEQPKASIVLSASDEQFQLSSSNGVRPTTEWQFDRKRARFERVIATESGAMTNLN